MISNVKKMAISIALFSNGTNAIVMEVASVVGLNLVSAVGVNLRGSLTSSQSTVDDNQLEQKKSGPLSEADIFKQKVAASGFRLFEELATKAMLKEQKNVFYSPFVMFANLLMVVQGTREDSKSRKDFMEFLGFADQEDLDKAVRTYPLIEEELRDTEGSEANVSIANLVYARKVNKAYLDNINNKMKASAEELIDADQINTDVKELTRGTIEKLLEKEDVKPLTIAVLVSTILIEDKWKHPLKRVPLKRPSGDLSKFAANFDEGIDVPYIGNIGDGTTPSYPYAEDICGAKAVKLPFQRKGDMLFLLPKKKGKDGLKTVVEKLAESSREKKFLSMIKDMKDADVDFSIPRHNVEWNADLKDYLEKRFPAPFDGYEIDSQGHKIQNQFGEMTSDETAHIAFIKHKAKYSVNEEGAAMSAAQATGMKSRGRGNKKIMKFDRPFVMVWIVDDMVVGVAQVIDPTIDEDTDQEDVTQSRSAKKQKDDSDDSD